jgi:hypothetical protein
MTGDAPDALPVSVSGTFVPWTICHDRGNQFDETV